VQRKLTDNWTVNTDGVESSYRHPVYIADECKHGCNVAHSLPEACACGLLRDVRKERGLTQQACADQIGVRVNTWALWERGEKSPTVSLLVRALERWLLEK